MKKTLLCFTTLITINLNADVGILTKISDGDTIRFGKDICRLANIDTPESSENPRLEKILKKCNTPKKEILDAGKKSSNHLSSYLKVGEEYKYTVINNNDGKGRKVCLINLSNNETVNLKMVEDGYAYPYFYFIPSYMKKRYKDALDYAQENKKGLFKTHSNVMECLKKGVM